MNNFVDCGYNPQKYAWEGEGDTHYIKMLHRLPPDHEMGGLNFDKKGIQTAN